MSDTNTHITSEPTNVSQVLSRVQGHELYKVGTTGQRIFHTHTLQLGKLRVKFADGCLEGIPEEWPLLNHPPWGGGGEEGESGGR